ncbi:melanoma-associated antigen 8-like [Moschus berezovskii]|uniref:melanoma-associated antigen 8-like n=1 Tax=Moschus berezovskii TaxID=68408 RepID=UPI002444D520|nr:melanoma-associated antigen 8-like [Moschus berezovskii]
MKRRPTPTMASNAPEVSGERWDRLSTAFTRANVGAPGTKRPRRRSEARVLKSESRGGPGSTRNEGIVLLVEKSELSKPEEDLQDPGEAQGPVEVQRLGAEVGEAEAPSASSATVSSSAPGEALPQEVLKEMITNLMKFLLLKYSARELTSQAEMLKKVLKDNQEHFPVVFSQASECLQLVCGVEVREVDPTEHTYTTVPALGLTCDEMLSGGQGLPKAGLLVLVLRVIMRNGDPAPEEAVWGALSRMGVCVGREHSIFGEPRELLTQVWVQEGYLEYQQVLDSAPARYAFLWGPRAYAETSKQQGMEFVLRFRQRALRTFPLQSSEAERDVDKEA